MVEEVQIRAAEVAIALTSTSLRPVEHSRRLASWISSSLSARRRTIHSSIAMSCTSSKSAGAHARTAVSVGSHPISSANRAMKSPPYNSAPAIDIAAYRSLGGRIIMSVTVPVDLRESTRLIGAVVNDLALDDLHAQRRRQDEDQTVGCIKNPRPAGVVGECDQSRR